MAQKLEDLRTGAWGYGAQEDKPSKITRERENTRPSKTVAHTGCHNIIETERLVVRETTRQRCLKTKLRRDSAIEWQSYINALWQSARETVTHMLRVVVYVDILGETQQRATTAMMRTFMCTTWWILASRKGVHATRYWQACHAPQRLGRTCCIH